MESGMLVVGALTPHSPVSFDVEGLLLPVPCTSGPLFLFSSGEEDWHPICEDVTIASALSSLLFIWELLTWREEASSCPWQCRFCLCGYDQQFFSVGVNYIQRCIGQPVSL